MVVVFLETMQYIHDTFVSATLLHLLPFTQGTLAVLLFVPVFTMCDGFIKFRKETYGRGNWCGRI